MEGLIGVSLAELAMLAAVAFGSNVFGGISGFGAGLINAPFLLPIVGVKAVVPIMAPALMIGGLSRIWVFRHHLVPQVLPRFVLSIAPGVLLGALIYDSLPPGPLAILIGTLLIASVWLRRYFKQRAIKPSPRGVAALSFVTGVIAGGSPGGGIILVSLLLGLGLQGAAIVATDAVIGLSVNVLRIAIFSGIGLQSAQLLLLGSVLGLVMVPGAYFARWIVGRLKVSWHVALIEAFILIGGFSFLYQGLLD